MRIDLCRKCGHEMEKGESAESCKICGKDFKQFACVKCSFITEPQYHIHKIKLEALAFTS